MCEHVACMREMISAYYLRDRHKWGDCTQTDIRDVKCDYETSSFG